MKRTFAKWLSILLAACLLLSAPMALMEEAPEPAPVVDELEAPVEEVALELGGEEEQEQVVEIVETPAEETVSFEANNESESDPEIDPESYPWWIYEEDDDEEERTPPTSIQVTPTNVNLSGGDYFDIEYSVQPEGAYEGVGVSSSDHSVASVEELTVHALRPGSAVITLTTVNGLTAQINVKVTGTAPDLATGIAIDSKNFPNQTFRSFVADAMDWNRDGVLDDEEIENNTEIWVDEGDVDSFKGIELFPNLEVLNCSQHSNLTSLDISKNTKLRDLYVNDCNLSALDVSNNPELYALFTHGNPNLTKLDVSKSPALVNAMRGDAKAEDGHVHYYGEHGELSVDLTTHVTPHIDAVNFVNFPDETFRNYVAENIDTNGDGVLSGDERGAVKSIVLDGRQVPEYTEITSLKGMNMFTHLEELVTRSVNIKELDIRDFKELKKLQLAGLDSLNISNSTKLESLTLSDCNFKTFDLTQMTQLKVLYFVHSNLESIDLSKNTALEELNLESNKLTALNISANTRLKELYIEENSIKELDIYNAPALLNLVTTVTPEEVNGYLQYKNENAWMTIDKDVKLITESSKPVNPTSITVSGPSSIKLSAGKVKLSCTVLPANHLGDVKWSVSPTSNASIGKDGELTPKKAGKVTVTAAATKGSAKGTLNIEIVDDTIPAKVTITSPEGQSISLGKKTVTLGLSIEPATADKSVKWSVSPSGYATIDKAGKLTLKKGGKVTVTATAKGDVKGTLDIEIVDDSTPSSITITSPDGAAVSLSKKTLTLGLEILPATAEKTVTWKAKPTSVATVKNGVLTLKKDGEVEITATSKKNKQVVGTLKLRVVDDTMPTDVKIASTGLPVLESGALSCNLSQKIINLSAKMEPATAVSNLTWKASPSGIATVKDGKVTLKKHGDVTITVTTKRGNKSASVKLHVVDDSIPESITIASDKGTVIDKRDTAQLTASVLPATAEKGVKWKITAANPKGCAMLNNKGLLKAKKVGTVTITATSTKDKTVSGSITINITDLRAPTGITIDQGSAMELEVKKKATLTATLKADNGQVPEAKLTWKSDNTGVAKVNGKTGVVTAGKKPGTAKITVTTDNGLSASITITVK